MPTPANSLRDAARLVRLARARVRPAAGKSVFWTGWDDLGRTARIDANAYAELHHKLTLSMSLQRAKIWVPQHQTYTKRLWRDMSRLYALRSSGDVIAVIGKNTRTNSTYNNIERQILIRSKTVTTLTEVNVDTGRSNRVK
jgi:hypothetical protein